MRTKKREKMKSKTPRKALMTTITINTTMVKLIASCRVGHVTLRNSPIVSRKIARRHSVFFEKTFYLLLPQNTPSGNVKYRFTEELRAKRRL